MKKNIMTYIAAAVIGLALSSCSDFLEQVNPNEISTGSYWKTLGDCEKGLTSVYNQFRNPNIMGVQDENNRSDLTFPGWGRPNTSNEYYLQMFTASSGGANNKWDALYKGIFRANQVISGLSGIESEMKTDEEVERWTYAMGQARFFRGLFYFYLHSSYNKGSVILYDFVPQSEADFNQPLSDEGIIKEFFRKDLEYARKILPKKWTTYNATGSPDPDNDLGRVTSGAAAAVLGKSYLYEKDYTTAADYFREVITSGVYRLVDVADNFTTRGEFNQESILEIAYNLNTKVEENQYSAEGTVNTYNLVFSPAGSIGGWRSNYPANWLILAYRNDPMDPSDPRNIVVDGAGNSHLRKFSLRTSYSVALVDDPDLEYYGGVTADMGQFNNGETAYWRKYTNWDIGVNEKDNNGKSGINFRVIRLADVYLMYAECLIEGGMNDGGVTEALKYINKVRYRSALLLLGQSAAGEYGSSTYDEQTYSAEDLMNRLMFKERPLELSAEGFAIRQIDLRRWGITKTRLEDLASRKYWLSDYPYYSPKQGQQVTKWGAILEEGYNPNYNGRDMSEFTRSGVNFDEQRHAYWPIPTSETTANSMVN